MEISYDYDKCEHLMKVYMASNSTVKNIGDEESDQESLRCKIILVIR